MADYRKHSEADVLLTSGTAPIRATRLISTVAGVAIGTGSFDLRLKSIWLKAQIIAHPSTGTQVAAGHMGLVKHDSYGQTAPVETEIYPAVEATLPSYLSLIHI